MWHASRGCHVVGHVCHVQLSSSLCAVKLPHIYSMLRLLELHRQAQKYDRQRNLTSDHALTNGFQLVYYRKCPVDKQAAKAQPNQSPWLAYNFL